MAVNPMRCFDETITLVSKWDIGASGAHTKTSGVPGTGFTGVARTAAGEYTISFARGLPVGPLVELRCVQESAVDEEPKLLKPCVGTFTAETAAAAATVKYEAWDVDETAVEVEIPSGGKVSITATFLKTK